MYKSVDSVSPSNKVQCKNISTFLSLKGNKRKT